MPLPEESFTRNYQTRYSTAAASGEALRMREKMGTNYEEPLEVMSDNSFRDKFGWPAEELKIGGGNIAQVFESKQSKFVLKFVNFSNGTEHALQEAIAYSRTQGSKGKTPIAKCQFGFENGLIIAVPKVTGVSRNQALSTLNEIYVGSPRIAEKRLQLNKRNIISLLKAILAGSDNSFTIRDIKLDGSLTEIRNDRYVGEVNWVDFNAAFIIPQANALIKASIEWESLCHRLGSLEIRSRLPVKRVMSAKESAEKLVSAIEALQGSDNLSAAEIFSLSSNIRDCIADIANNSLIREGDGSIASSLKSLEGERPDKPLFAQIRSSFDDDSYLLEVKEWVKKIESVLDVNSFKDILYLAKIMQIVDAISLEDVGDLLVRMVGFNDAKLAELIGAESLVQTYLDNPVRDELRKMIFHFSNKLMTLHAQIKAGGELSSFLKDLENPFTLWFKIYQQEMDRDWELLKSKVSGVEGLDKLDWDRFDDLLVNRLERTEKISSKLESSFDFREAWDELKSIDRKLAEEVARMIDLVGYI